MKKLLLSILSICLILPALSQTDNRLKNIDAELHKVLEATHAPGFAVGVVEGDKIIYAKGFGYRDYENKIPVDANTLFAIGSSSKAFTSAILGKLRADNKLSFNDSPLDYIPDLKFYNDEMNNNIIIKDLMRHSTGLPRHDLSWYYFPTHSKDSLIKRVQYQEPFTGVRQQWYYNNFMFLAQGVLAEKITGQSWEDNIKEMFFKPLGMTRSNSTIAEMKAATNAAFGYELKKGDVISKMDYYDIAGMSPAGSINSSVNDMSKWLMTWINKGKFNDKEIIPENYITEAISSQMVIDAALPDEELPDMHFANYGYGWMLQSYRGHYRVEHGGNIDGFSASVALYPTDKLGIVVLTNQNGSAATGLVRNTIADRLLGGKTTDWVKRYLEAKEKNKKTQEESDANPSSLKIDNTKPSHTKIDYTGIYSNPGYGSLEINVENDSLFTTLNGTKQLVNHYHYDTFELIDVIDNKVDTSQIGKAFKITFNTNANGDISGASFKAEPMLDDLIFERTPNTIELSTEELNKYTGKYELQPGFILEITAANGRIFAQATGQGKNEIFAKKENHFFFKVVEAQLVFSKDDNGNVNMLTLHQGGAKIPAKKIE